MAAIVNPYEIDTSKATKKYRIGGSFVADELTYFLGVEVESRLGEFERGNTTVENPEDLGWGYIRLLSKGGWLHVIPGREREAWSLTNNAADIMRDRTWENAGYVIAANSCQKLANEIRADMGTEASKTATENWLPVAERVVERHQAEEVDGVLLDAATAGLLVGIVEHLSPEKVGKFTSLSLPEAVSVAWKLVDSGAVGVGFASRDYTVGYKQGFVDALREAAVEADMSWSEAREEEAWADYAYEAKQSGIVPTQEGFKHWLATGEVSDNPADLEPHLVDTNSPW